MSDAVVLLRQLEACLAEELYAQARTQARLEEQGAALRAGEPAGIEARTRALDVDLAGLATRGARRAQIVRALASAWRVDARALSLASIAERAGPEGARLAKLRRELRHAASKVATTVRRNARAARGHQQTWSEILEGVVAGLTGNAVEGGGRLIDAEA